jgi:hypothetical protein
MQLKLALTAAAGAALLIGALPATAHHAVQASVDINRTIEAKAVLTRVDWINPHTWMRFDVTLPNGTVQKNVMIESLGINAFRQVGVNSSRALQVGETFSIVYFPNRTGEPGGFMTRMTLPDGRTFSAENADPGAVPKPAQTQ